MASNNAHKLREFRDILSGEDVELVSAREAGCDFETEETGESFEENARLKASAVTRATGLPALADDSGLCVDALGGEPGVYSARYTGSQEDSDAVRYRFLLQKLRDTEHRAARFVSCICCTFPDGGEILARGECEGEILHAPRGENGFGYDPVFQPAGYEVSMAEMTAEQKNAVSHRGRALDQFKERLREYHAAHK
jgi:XTP/dITP diphosphohydrolase